MLNADLTVVDNHSSLTLPGLLGSKVYAQITGPIGQKIVRRVAATANTAPQTLTIGHEVSGSGGGETVSSLIRYDYSVRSADLSLTGGIIPKMSAQLVIRRHSQQGTYITDPIVTNGIAALLDVILTSGQLAKLLNQEA